MTAFWRETSKIKRLTISRSPNDLSLFKDSSEHTSVQESWRSTWKRSSRYGRSTRIVPKRRKHGMHISRQPIYSGSIESKSGSGHWFKRHGQDPESPFRPKRHGMRCLKWPIQSFWITRRISTRQCMALDLWSDYDRQTRAVAIFKGGRAPVVEPREERHDQGALFSRGSLYYIFSLKPLLPGVRRNLLLLLIFWTCRNKTSIKWKLAMNCNIK